VAAPMKGKAAVIFFARGNSAFFMRHKPPESRVLFVHTTNIFIIRFMYFIAAQMQAN
jgi:hypothetical protein